jgi:hypothetical protein
MHGLQWDYSFLRSTHGEKDPYVKRKHPTPQRRRKEKEKEGVRKKERRRRNIGRLYKEHLVRRQIAK